MATTKLNDDTKKSSDMTPEEMLDVACSDGMELSDEQLEGICGGGEWYNERTAFDDFVDDIFD